MAEREREREREREKERERDLFMHSLYPLFVSIRNQINLVRKVHSQIDQRISGAHLSKFSRFCFSRSRFPERQSLQMPTGKTVIRLCGSSFVEFRSQMP